MRTALQLVFLAIPVLAFDSAPTAAVTGGQIRGSVLEHVSERGGAVFKGIPFAQPPVGDLRWRPPLPVKSWTGVRDATSFGAPCAQNSGNRHDGEQPGRLSLSERMDAGMARESSQTRHGLVSRRRQLRGHGVQGQLRWREPGAARRGAGNRQLPAHGFRIFRASRADARIARIMRPEITV